MVNCRRRKPRPVGKTPYDCPLLDTVYQWVCIRQLARSASRESSSSSVNSVVHVVIDYLFIVQRQSRASNTRIHRNCAIPDTASYFRPTKSSPVASKPSRPSESSPTSSPRNSAQRCSSGIFILQKYEKFIDFLRPQKILPGPGEIWTENRRKTRETPARVESLNILINFEKKKSNQKNQKTKSQMTKTQKKTSPNNKKKF